MSNKSTASSRSSRRSSSNGRSNSNERNNAATDGHRNRSPSPTEFFREQYQIQKKLFKREYELQQFIHQGIMKFLDKQAVRDLIYAYDHDDIFIHGEKEFFENVFNDDDDVNGDGNSKRKDKLQLLKHQHSKFFKLINQVNLSQENNKSKELINKNNPNGDYESGQQQQQNRSQSQNWNLTWFLTSVWVQLFNVKSRNKIHERRDSHILDDLLEKQQLQKQQQQQIQQQNKDKEKNLNKIPSPF